MSGVIPHLQLVWFRRDLRVRDHAPLTQALLQGPVLPLYIAEPELWAEPDASARHWAFIRQSLSELRDELEGLGQRMVLRQGDAVAILDDLHGAYGQFTLWSHEETGNGWMRRRDAAVRRWAQDSGTVWHELPQPGIIRELRGPAARTRILDEVSSSGIAGGRIHDHTGWARVWEQQIHLPPLPAPRPVGHPMLGRGLQIPSETLPRLDAFGWIGPGTGDDASARQQGGSSAGADLLESFLAERGARYCAERRDPLNSADACTRLSAHLTYGTVSVREVASACFHRLAEIEGVSVLERRRWEPAVKAVIARLGWRARCLQIFEDDPTLEFAGRADSYAAQGEEVDGERLAAFEAGETGFPLIDAAMRALTRTGWVNFRLRALLASFSCQQLALPWRAPALLLARRFTDYEPAIHYAQMQVQAGVAGLGAPSVRDVKAEQALIDPEGRFIDRWLGQRRAPPPIIDADTASRAAAERLARARDSAYTLDPAGPRREPQLIGHRSSLRPRHRPVADTAPSPQLQLPL